MVRLFLAVCSLILLASSLPCRAAEYSAGDSPQVTVDHAYCREVAALAQKYGVDRKLPDAAAVPGKPCPAGEAAACLLAVIDKVQEKCAKEGKDAVPREDMDRIAVLHEALKAELAQHEGYLTRREAIEVLLARADEPALLYKFGVAGFLRGDGAGNFHLADNSYAPGHAEGRFVYRVKPYVYWHPTDWLDIHAEGQGYGYTGGSSQEYNKVSLYQGFVEAKLPGSEALALKGGRQEFNYGSAFVLGTDSFFDGLTFDAARLRVKPAGPLSIDLLAGAYATPFSGGVDGTLAGGYATYVFSEGNAVEAYLVHDAGSLRRKAGEYLNLWGMRGTAKLGSLSFEIEPVYESGRAYGLSGGAAEQVSAYGGHLDLNVDTALGAYHNHLFFSFALGSGDKAAANGISSKKEFRNPNNDSALVGDMHVFSDLSGTTVNGHHASGLQIYTLGWGLDITKEINFSATGRYFVANAVEAGFSRNLGLETDFILTWNAAEGLTFLAGYDRFFTGAFFRDASGSGRDIDYGYLMVQFDLSKSKPKLARK